MYFYFIIILFYFFPLCCLVSPDNFLENDWCKEITYYSIFQPETLWLNPHWKDFSCMNKYLRVSTSQNSNLLESSQNGNGSGGLYGGYSSIRGTSYVQRSTPTPPSFRQRAGSVIRRSSLFFMNWYLEAKEGIIELLRTNEGKMLLGFILLLMLTTSTERVTFKMTVDRMLPYKFVLIQIIYLFSSISFLFAYLCRKKDIELIENHSGSFPYQKVFYMALLDTIPFMMMVFSASDISPTMTIILLHASTPCIVLSSRIYFPQRTYSSYHIAGVILISLAILVAVCSKILWEVFELQQHEIMKSILSISGYTIAAALQGICTTYKEKVIIDWASPMNIYSLSSLLFFYQFLVVVVIAFFYYLIEGISSHFTYFF
jgi:hypothetical protein